MTVTRTRMDVAPLSAGWEAEARQWIQWARTPGHDSYWRFHRDQFLRLLPPPGRQTLDIGCGEGRLARDLKALGHRIIAIDRSPSLAAAARESDPSMDVRLADAAALPLDDACADLAVAFMSLQDIDDMPAAIQEAARVLQPGGRFCLAIVHPMNSAGSFEEETADAHFVIKGDYLGAFHYADAVERDGLTMTFNSLHRPLEAYFMALEKAGLLVESLREPSLPDHAIAAGSGRRWQRIPYFLHLRTVRP
jgi:SAM-dependent methyltransferase